MRYILALIVAALLIAGVIFYARLTIGEIESRMREKIQEKQRAGELPPGTDISDVGFQLSAANMRRFKLARSLLEYWFVWGPAVTALCLGVAAVIYRSGDNASR
jgi:hypothetical protein